MRFPNALKKGDTIGLAAPAFPLSKENRDACVSRIQEMGYEVILGENLLGLYNVHNYLAGGGKVRAAALNRMFANPRVKAIFCVRGGYGSSHIMKYLDFELIRANPKIFVGYSDITNLHLAIGKFCDFVTFHGPMVYSNMLNQYDSYTKQSFEDVLDMKESWEFKNPEGGNEIQIIHDGVAEGTVVGGNLSLLARSAGTFFQPNCKGKLLFMEDIEESIPLLDMYLTQMEYAGMLYDIRGILLGNFTDCNHNRYDPSYGIDEFLEERLSGHGVPIMSHIQSGHEKPMGTIPLGARCRMDTFEKKITFFRS